jgi:hypothetical protein
LEPIPAVLVTLVAPVVLLKLAEMSGYVHIVKINHENPDSKLELSKREQLNSQQAADKYGWAIVVEMDQKIKIMQEQIQLAQKAREDFAALIKKDQK